MSDGRCREFDAASAGGGPLRDAAIGWREHLAGCADCREQAAADALPRGALTPPPPALSADFEVRLRRRIERRAAAPPAVTGRRGGLRPAGLLTLAAYGTAATAASAVILARLPWESLSPSPVALAALGALALLSPLVLLDRFGIVRPPG